MPDNHIENKGQGLVRAIQWFGMTALLTLIVLIGWVLVSGDKQTVAALKWFQFLQTTATFLLPPLVMAYIWSKQPMAWLKLDRKPSNLVFAAVLLMVLAMPGINLLADWNSRLVLPAFLAPLEAWMQAQEQAAAALTERFLCVSGFGALLVNIGLMALLPALAEELTFRGVIQRLITGDAPSMRRMHAAVWITAVLFSAIHMQFYGFVPRMLLGALFGYMLCWTGNLWVPIAMHFTNNCIAVIGYWIVYRKGINPDSVDAFGSGETAWLGWLSLVLTAAGVYACWRLSRTMSNASSRIS